MADGRHIENSFLAISQRDILADQCEIWIRDEESRADIGPLTKTATFAN